MPYRRAGVREIFTASEYLRIGYYASPKEVYTVTIAPRYLQIFLRIRIDIQLIEHQLTGQREVVPEICTVG